MIRNLAPFARTFGEGTSEVWREGEGGFEWIARSVEQTPLFHIPPVSLRDNDEGGFKSKRDKLGTPGTSKKVLSLLFRTLWDFGEAFFATLKPPPPPFA